MGKDSGRQLWRRGEHAFVSEGSVEFRRKAQQRGHDMEGTSGGVSVNGVHICNVLPQMREEAVIFMYSERNYMLL